MTTTPPAGTPQATPEWPQGSHHFAITLQIPIYDGFQVSTYVGTLTPAPGQTRHDLYQQLRAELAANNPRMADASVLFFSLESNTL